MGGNGSGTNAKVGEPSTAEQVKVEDVATLFGLTEEERYETLWESRIGNVGGSNVTFKVGPTLTPVPAHRLFLSVRSDFFKDLFQKMDDGGGSEVESITFKELNVDAFKDLLNYLYTGKYLLPGKTSAADKIVHLFEVVTAATMIRCEDAIEKCDDVVRSLSTAETIWDVVCMLDESYSSSPVAKWVLRTISGNANILLANPSFERIPEYWLYAVIGHSYLNCEELVVFKAAMRWAKYQFALNNQSSGKETPEEVSGPKLRKLLGRSFYEIRFPLIPQTELVGTVQKEQVLGDKEMLEIVLFITMPDRMCDYKSYPRLGQSKIITTIKQERVCVKIENDDSA